LSRQSQEKADGVTPAGFFSGPPFQCGTSALLIYRFRAQTCAHCIRNAIPTHCTSVPYVQFDAAAEEIGMRDVSHLKFIGSSYCSQYRTGASFYIDETHATGMRHLVVIYENDKSDFLAGIPDDWADENVQDFIFWPMKNPNSPYPAWEVPARVYGNPMLFAWWKSRPPVRQAASALS
jgi:hypothetical protein